jgi:hypothetical protein
MPQWTVMGSREVLLGTAGSYSCSTDTFSILLPDLVSS